MCVYSLPELRARRIGCGGNAPIATASSFRLCPRQTLQDGGEKSWVSLWAPISSRHLFLAYIPRTKGFDALLLAVATRTRLVWCRRIEPTLFIGESSLQKAKDRRTWWRNCRCEEGVEEGARHGGFSKQGAFNLGKGQRRPAVTNLVQCTPPGKSSDHRNIVFLYKSTQNAAFLLCFLCKKLKLCTCNNHYNSVVGNHHEFFDSWDFCGEQGPFLLFARATV